MKNDLRQWQELERRDWQLWLLAIFLLVILGFGLLTFMFPSAFWANSDPASLPQKAFVGFSALYGLAIVYMLQRQAEIRRLRQQLFDAQAAIAEAEHTATEQMLRALPDSGPFRDALAMEYRRASSSGHALTAVVLALPRERKQDVGRLARHLCSAIRPGESLYRITDSAFGLILPKMDPRDVAAVIARAQSASGVPEGLLETNIVSYPMEAGSLSEMEKRLRATAGTELQPA